MSMSTDPYTVPAGAQCVIYRLTSARASLAAVTVGDDKVVFGSMSAGVVDWSSSLERFRPSIPAPSAEAANKPDAGANLLHVSLDCVVHRQDMGSMPGSRAETPADTLRKWAVLPQVVPGVYDRGNVGLWFWPDETLTHHPTRNTGYKVSSVGVSGMPNMPSKLALRVELEWAGEFDDHEGLGA